MIAENTDIEIQAQNAETEKKALEVVKGIDELYTVYDTLDDSLKWPSEVDWAIEEFLKTYLSKSKSESEIKTYALRYSQYLVSFNKIQEKINSWLELNEKEKEFVAMFTELNQNLGIEIAIAIPITLKSMNPETYETKTVLRSISMKDAPNALLENKDAQGYINNKVENSNNFEDLSKYAIEEFKKAYPEYSDVVSEDWTIKDEKVKEKNVNKATLNQIIQDYIAQYKEKRKYILNMIHERALIGCFKGLTTYFDINSINQENFIKDIKLNINDDITVNNHELYVRWSIKWKNIWIYYNMDNWTVEMDDFLHKDGEWNLFVWANHWIRETLAFTLPKYDDLVDQWWKIDFSGILKENDTETSINKKIQTTLDKTMDSSFKNENINKFIVWKHMEEYVAEQEILDHIFQNRLTWANYDPNLDFRQRDIKIEKSNNPNQHKLLSIINNTIEAQKTPNGLQRFRQAINKLDYFIERAKHQEKIKI